MATVERQKALFGHCVRVYDAMKNDENSKQVEVEQLITSADEETTVTLYTGFLTRLFDTLGLSVPYYTEVMTTLKRMDCVRQVRRGGGTSPSQWALLRPPNEALYDEMYLPRQIMQSALGPAIPQAEQVMQMLRDFDGRLKKVESVVYVNPEEVGQGA